MKTRRSRSTAGWSSKPAYSSGTPAYGVGNSVHVVDETADLDEAVLFRSYLAPDQTGGVKKRTT
ncbi:hypothetical protein [Methylomicrobium album]|uniref:hypothetical protein n=1 Tax=Methylomicrobium album TaxID=39775 RepID=UPI0002623DDA|nr:hypothetical protein [Methylomicrobium album]